ncbi:MAG: membrane protein [Planctomycetaceae bacterium]
MSNGEHEVNSRSEKTSSGKWSHWAKRLEVDRAVIYSLCLRGWQLLAGAVSAILIARWFSPDVQGYYYTFSSLLTLQAIFELGCAQVVTNVASHEWSHLSLDDAGRIQGDRNAKSRLVSLGRFVFKLYGGVALLFVLLVGLGGAWFLGQQPAGDVLWRTPWFCLVAVSGLLLWTLPFNALLEGCHQVATVSRFRFFQAVATNFAVWTSLVLELNLWVAVIATTTRLVCELVLLLVRYRRFMGVFLFPPESERINWREELWPLQWRLGLQSACGFLSTSLYAPVMFYYHSKAVAGRMGMTWMMMFAVQAAALSWIQTRIPRFGVLIARREYDTLDRLFRRLTWISMAVVSLGGVLLCLTVWLLNVFEFSLAGRVLQPDVTAVFMFAIVVLQLSHCQAAYIRAHKRDPLLVVNMASYLLTGLGVWWFGSQYGPWGAGLVYLCVILFVTTPFHSWLWWQCRKDWHSEDTLT